MHSTRATPPTKATTLHWHQELLTSHALCIHAQQKEDWPVLKTYAGVPGLVNVNRYNSSLTIWSGAAGAQPE